MKSQNLGKIKSNLGGGGMISGNYPTQTQNKCKTFYFGPFRSLAGPWTSLGIQTPSSFYNAFKNLKILKIYVLKTLVDQTFLHPQSPECLWFTRKYNHPHSTLSPQFPFGLWELQQERYLSSSIFSGAPPPAPEPGKSMRCGDGARTTQQLTTIRYFGRFCNLGL